jgi:hypothetical protein
MYVCGYKMVGTEVLNILVNEKCLMKWELEAKKKGNPNVENSGL